MTNKYHKNTTFLYVLVIILFMLLQIDALVNYHDRAILTCCWTRNYLSPATLAWRESWRCFWVPLKIEIRTDTSCIYSITSNHYCRGDGGGRLCSIVVESYNVCPLYTGWRHWPYCKKTPNDNTLWSIQDRVTNLFCVLSKLKWIKMRGKILFPDCVLLHLFLFHGCLTHGHHA